MRKITILLILSLLLSLVVPVSAESFVWTDLIQSGYVALTTTHFDSSNDHTIPLYPSQNTGFSRLRFYFNADPNLTYATWFDDVLIITNYIGNGLYMAEVPNSFTLTPGSFFRVQSSGNTTIDVYSIEASRYVSYSSPSSVGVTGIMYFSDSNGNIHTVHSGSSVPCPEQLRMSASPSQGDVAYDATFYFYPNNVDYLTGSFLVDAQSIQSISCSGNFPLEYTISEQNISGPRNNFRVSFSIDVSNRIAQSYSSSPVVVHILGSLGSGTNAVTLQSGWDCWVMPSDTSNSIWFFRWFSALSGQFASLSNSLSVWFQSVFDHFAQWYTVQFTWLQNIHDKTADIITSISQNFSDLHTWMKSLTGMITNRLDKLINGDTTDSNSFNQAVSDAQNDIDSANAVIDSVSRPDINTIDINLDTVVSPADIYLASGIFSSVFQNSFLFNLFFMGLTLSLVSYVIFGKRGG